MDRKAWQASVHEVSKSRTQPGDQACACMLSCFKTSDSLRLYGLQPFRPLCPWDSLGKNTGVGCHFLLQGIFLTRNGRRVSYVYLHWLPVFFTTSATLEALSTHTHTVKTVYYNYVLTNRLITSINSDNMHKNGRQPRFSSLGVSTFSLRILSKQCWSIHL